MNEEKKFEIGQEVRRAIEKFRESLPERSFSGRHPEQGRMVNCQICGRRHRAVPECIERILVPVKSKRGILGASKFRIRPHHGARLLRRVELTQILFSKYYPGQIQDPQKAMEAARGEAKAIQRRVYAEIRAAHQQQQHRSRQINRNLIAGGIR